MSLPLKMMYSKVSSRGGMGLSVGRSSVPKERTDKKQTAQLAPPLAPSLAPDVKGG